MSISKQTRSLSETMTCDNDADVNSTLHLEVIDSTELGRDSLSISTFVELTVTVKGFLGPERRSNVHGGITKALAKRVM